MAISIHSRKIILEGPDGSGKTHLATRLADALGLDYIHCTYYKDPELMRIQFYDVLRRLSDDKKGFIVDRFILSNIIYGIVFHKCEFTDGWKIILDAFAKSITSDVELVICLPKDKQAYLSKFEELTKSREEMYCSVEDMSKIYDLYEMFYTLLKSSNVNVSRFDWTVAAKNK